MDKSNPPSATFETRHRCKRSNKIAASLIFITLISLAPVAGANACQGTDFQKSRQIIEQAWVIGNNLANQIVWGQIDVFIALNNMVEQLQHLNAQAAALPYSCQVLIQQWSNAIAASMSAGGSGGGTQCMSGVCCDGTGCY